MSAVTRVGDLPFPGLFVLRSEINCYFGGPSEVLHVISSHAGGEIRGYTRPKGADGAFRLRHPAYPEFWEELDIATSALVGAPCNGFDAGCSRDATPVPPGQLSLALESSP